MGLDDLTPDDWKMMEDVNTFMRERRRILDLRPPGDDVFVNDMPCGSVVLIKDGMIDGTEVVAVWDEDGFHIDIGEMVCNLKKFKIPGAICDAANGVGKILDAIEEAEDIMRESGATMIERYFRHHIAAHIVSEKDMATVFAEVAIVGTK